jgi:DNA polymerase I-like protein with 3'-5' exonuclease and polymerase domains
LLGSQINGRIHCLFHPVKNDEGGAVTGRFSSSNPNLQQVPSRDERIGPLIRGLFLPDEGHQWFCLDWSQVEYRLLVHYAVLNRSTGATEVLNQYLADTRTDYHSIVQALVKEKLGRDVPRSKIKNVNFGIIYGMGVEKLGSTIGMDPDEMEEFLKAYHAAIPFANEMKKDVTAVANRRGFIKTILGRRRRFDSWESRDWDTSRDDSPTTYEAAIEKYSGVRNIKRAGTFKALNALIQGSAADLMKMAMLKAWNAGLTSGTGGPLRIHLTVHDELDGSIPDSKEGTEALAELKNIMETAIPLKIPMLAEGGIGENWAKAK